MNDPDPRSFNKCKKKLNNRKIAVFNNILISSTKKFYKSYIKSKTVSLPYLTAKLAISRDHYTKSKNNEWITNSYSRGRVHLLRSEHDCIISSINTIVEDNPMLTCRIRGLERTSPARIILDKDLKIPLRSKILKFANKHQTYIFYNNHNKKKINKLKKLKIKLCKIPITNNGNLDLEKVLARAKFIGFSRIFLECGTKLLSSFLSENLVNDFHLFISSKKLGINGKKSFEKELKKFLYQKKSINQKVYLFGDKFISYSIK